VVSAVSLAAIAVGLCAMKQESRLFNRCVETVVAEGRSQAEAVRLQWRLRFKTNPSKGLFPTPLGEPAFWPRSGFRFGLKR